MAAIKHFSRICAWNRDSNRRLVAVVVFGVATDDQLLLVKVQQTCVCRTREREREIALKRKINGRGFSITHAARTFSISPLDVGNKEDDFEKSRRH